MELSKICEINFLALKKNISKIKRKKPSLNYESCIIEFYSKYKSIYKKIKDFDGEQYYIHFSKEIPRGETFTSSFFTPTILKFVEENMSFAVLYKFIISKVKKVDLYFISEVEMDMDLINLYAKNVFSWLQFAAEYANSKCGNDLTIYIYLTPFKKFLPKDQIEPLGPFQINSGLSTVCKKNTEISIFRKEEWFKVLIHETFHNYGLDFSDQRIDDLKSEIKKIFLVSSEFEIYEAYAEFWAVFFNCLITSYHLTPKTKSYLDFRLLFDYMLKGEQLFSLFQTVKILKFMGLEYKNLYEKNEESRLLRNTFYKEETNVFSYYILKNIMLNDYVSFIEWCKLKNPLIFNFSTVNIKSFGCWLKDNYKSPLLLKNIDYVERLMHSQKNKFGNTELFNSLRMSLCEFK